MSIPAVGEPAPDFTLPSSDREPVTLSSYRGTSNVLLAFFPMAFTGVCEASMCDLSEALDRFTAGDTVVLGISVDQGPSLAAFKAQHGMQHLLLSDSRRDVCRRYGTLNEEFQFSERAYFLIDKGGTVRWTHVEDTIGDRRDNGELLVQLEALS